MLITGQGKGREQAGGWWLAGRVELVFSSVMIHSSVTMLGHDT